MASRKKSEGIALLSMYNDDEDDDEDTEDINHDLQQQQDREEFQNQEVADDEEDGMQLDSSNDNLYPGADYLMIANQASSPALNNSFAAHESSLRPSTPYKEHFAAIIEVRKTVEKTKPSIVDYGHDEVAMSPEHEEPSSTGVGFVYHDAFQQKEVARIVPALSPGFSISQALEDVDSSHSIRESIDTNLIDIPGIISDQVLHLLDRFLPPPPKDNCSDELQRRIKKFLALKKVRRSYNAEVRNRKDYRNPDFLLHAVRYQDIDEIGSCFSKEVFDPSGYDKSDYYDAIELDMKREREKKEQELRKSPKVEFVSGGSQPGLLVPMKFGLPQPGMAASGLLSVPTVPDLPARDGRQSKKSKWDTMKLEPDGKSLVSSGSVDPLVTNAAQTHAASANVGSGYATYLEHKRREAEGKRSSDKKLERRS